MIVWIPSTLALPITTAIAATAVHAGPCLQRTSHHCVDTGSVVDLNSVPDITQQIVNQEPIAQKQKALSAEPPVLAPYTGPIVGVTSGKRTPTVGYSWSLE
jgi:hypothetical protein